LTVTKTTKLVIVFSRQNYTTLFHNELGDPYIPRTNSIKCLNFFYLLSTTFSAACSLHSSSV